MARFDHPNFGDVQDHVFITGTLTRLDAKTDTATVWLDDGGRADKVPLFFNCKDYQNYELDGKDPLRESGAMVGAYRAYWNLEPSDKVIVMCTGTPGNYTPIKVIGHADGIKRCSWEPWGLDVDQNHPWVHYMHFADVKSSTCAPLGEATHPPYPTLHDIDGSIQHRLEDGDLNAFYRFLIGNTKPAVFWPNSPNNCHYMNQINNQLVWIGDFDWFLGGNLNPVLSEWVSGSQLETFFAPSLALREEGMIEDANYLVLKAPASFSGNMITGECFLLLICDNDNAVYVHLTGTRFCYENLPGCMDHGDGQYIAHQGACRDYLVPGFGEANSYFYYDYGNYHIYSHANESGEIIIDLNALDFTGSPYGETWSNKVNYIGFGSRFFWNTTDINHWDLTMLLDYIDFQKDTPPGFSE